MPYPLLTGTVRPTAGVSTPDLGGQTLRLSFTRETWRAPVPPTARTSDGIAFGPTLSPTGGGSGGPVAPPAPTTGQLWPRGT